MPPDEIIDLLRTQPFRSFRIRMSNGRAFDIRHPEMARVTRSAVVLGVSDHQGAVPTGEEPAEEAVKLSLMHVAETELIY